MMLQFFITICVSLLCLTELSIQDPTINPNRRYTKQTYPKPFKRSPSPFLSPHNARVLNKKPPLNVHQNGPYFINHYIYCDNLDQHTFDQIKTGTLSSDKQIQLLNTHHHHHGFDALTPSLDSLEYSGGFSTGLNNGFKTSTTGLHHDFKASADGYHDFKTMSTYAGDKEIHILHLPKDIKPHDFEDIKLHLSLLDAHGTADTPKIDLDLNKNFGSFEVNLGSIKPPKLDSSLLPTPTTSSFTEVVKPLVQGQITAGLGHKYNIDLGHLTHYLSGNAGGSSSGFSSGSTEVLDVPHFEQHPLENDPGKSSYDTPGAVDSYGHPVTAPHQFHHNQHILGQPNLAHLIPNEHSGQFSSGSQNSLKNEDFYQPEEFFNQLNEIQELHRKRRQEIKGSENDVDKASSAEQSSGSPLEEEGGRHPNHRYDV